MRKPSISLFLVLLLLLAWNASIGSSGQGGGRPIPPGVREADKQGNGPIDSPASIKAKPIDAAAIKQEADELAKLSAAIPSQIDHVTQGQMPKDLADQLKHIEKLAKHLRSEVSP